MITKCVAKNRIEPTQGKKALSAVKCDNIIKPPKVDKTDAYLWYLDNTTFRYKPYANTKTGCCLKDGKAGMSYEFGKDEIIQYLEKNIENHSNLGGYFNRTDNYIVLDVDIKNSDERKNKWNKLLTEYNIKEMPITLSHHTKSNGYHFVWKMDEELRLLVDKIKVTKISVHDQLLEIMFDFKIALAGSSYKTGYYTFLRKTSPRIPSNKWKKLLIGLLSEYISINVNTKITASNENNRGTKIDTKGLKKGDYKDLTEKVVQQNMRDRLKINSEIIRDWANNIDVKYLEIYEDWRAILCSLKQASVENEDADMYKQLAREISKKANNYDEKSFEYKWNDCGKNGAYYTIGTLRYYSRISNPDKYAKITMKMHRFPEVNTLSDDDIAETFLNLNEGNFVVSKGVLYCYNGVYWEKSDNKCAKLNNKISDMAKNVYNKKIEESRLALDNNEITEEQSILIKYEIAQYEKLMLKVKSRVGIYNVADRIKDKVTMNVKWETHPELFYFNNKVFDLIKGEWITPSNRSYHYITTGYDYIEAEDDVDREKNKKYIREEIFGKILTDEKVRESYKCLLGRTLYGMVNIRFVFANGNGGNGKSKLHEIVQGMLGNYAYIAPHNLLCNGFKKDSGGDPSVANMTHKRMILYREPKRGITIDSGYLKEVTGGNKINARMLRENEVETKLSASHFLEANQKPCVPECDDALSRRILNIPFTSRFVSDISQVDNVSCFLIDTNLNIKIEDDNFKCAFFDVLMNDVLCDLQKTNFDVDPLLCQKILESTNEYFNERDSLATWFFETFEIIPEELIKSHHVYKIDEIYKLYRDTEDFHYKNKRKQYTKLQFKEDIQHSKALNKFYKDRLRTKSLLPSHVTEMTCVMVGIYKKTDCHISVDE